MTDFGLGFMVGTLTMIAGYMCGWVSGYLESRGAKHPEVDSK